MTTKSYLIRDFGGVEALTNLGAATLAGSPVNKTQHDLKADLISPILVTPNLGTPSAGVLTNCTGTAAGLTAGSVTTIPNLTGDVTSVGNATTLTNAPVIAKVLTGYTAGAGTISATDSILQAIQKLDGNDATNANLTGDVTSVGNATTITALDATKIADGTVTNTEFQYINSLTSNAQTQITARALDSAVIKKDGSVAFTADQPMGGFKVTGAADPASAQDLATKAYVDGLIDGRSWKTSVKAATTGPLTLASDFENGDTIDGYTLVTNDRVLNKDAASAAENGIYVVQASGAPVRATDADAASELVGAAVFVEQGTVNGDKQFAQSGDGGTFAANSVWVVTSSNSFSGHDMISLSGGQISVDLATSSGLESSNPGNAAGQLQIKLDGATLTKSASGLKLDALGTPTSGTLTNCTGLPVSTGISGLAAGVATFLATPSSANLATAVTDETGSGALVFATSPTLVTPALGTPASGVLTNCTGTASGLTAGTVTTNANLTGDVTSSGNVTTLTNAPVIAKVLTGFTSGAGSVSAADSILTAIQKLDGNIAAISAPLKYSATFGDGSSTNFVLTHSLGTVQLIPCVIKVSTGAVVETEVIFNSTSQVTINTTVAPIPNEYRITLLG